jgi:hypothetical protein
MARQRSDDYEREDDYRPRRRDDYDDGDRPRRRPPPPPESGGGNTAVKIIAIIGAVLLGIAVVCGGVVYYLVYSVKKGVSSLQEQLTQEMEKQKKRQENSNKTKSQKVVDAFMQELKGNRIEAAYQMTTAAYQKRVSLDELRELVKKNAATLQSGPPLRPNLFDPDTATTYVFSATAAVAGGFVKISLTIVAEGEGWKVDQLSVEPHDPFNKKP